MSYLPRPVSLIRLGALLVIAGQAVALWSQLEATPGTFLTFVLVAGSVTLLGALIGILGIVSRRAD